MRQGSYRSGKTGKSQGICLVRESQGKSGKTLQFEDSTGKIRENVLIFSQMRVFTSFLSSASVDVQMILHAMHWHSSSHLLTKITMCKSRDVVAYISCLH